MEPELTHKKTNLWPVFGGIAIILAVGSFLLLRGKTQSNATGNGNVEAAQSQTSLNQIIDPNAPVKEFTIDGSNFSFNPSTITVNKGDTVKIIFKDDDGTHNLAIDGYNVSTNVIGGGSRDSIQFVADKAGSFEYFCSVGAHRDLGMTGTLIVK